MQTADRLTLVLHDDTTTDLPAGTRYEYTAGGGRYITPDGDEGTWSSWAVLRVDAYAAAGDRDERPVA
jgi:hypothetical protein